MPFAIVNIFSFFLAFHAFATANTWQIDLPVKNNYLSKISGESVAYEYGYPGCGSCAAEPDVAFQLLFDELSGDLTDEVNALILSEKTDGGQPTFGTTASVTYSNLGDGVRYGSGSQACHRITTQVSELVIGTDDFVIEAWASPLGNQNGPYLFTTEDGSNGGYGVGIHGGSNRLRWFSEAADGTTFDTLAVDARLDNATDQLYKIRMVGDRDGNITFHLDGEEIHSTSMAVISGKSLPAPNIYVGNFYTCETDAAFFNSQAGHLNELRITIGNTTNNSGGPNGG